MRGEPGLEHLLGLLITHSGVVTRTWKRSPGCDEGLRGGKALPAFTQPSCWQGQESRCCDWTTLCLGGTWGLPSWKHPPLGQDRCLRLLKPQQPPPMLFV